MSLARPGPVAGEVAAGPEHRACHQSNSTPPVSRMATQGLL